MPPPPSFFTGQDRTKKGTRRVTKSLWAGFAHHTERHLVYKQHWVDSQHLPRPRPPHPHGAFLGFLASFLISFNLHSGQHPPAESRGPSGLLDQGCALQDGSQQPHAAISI